MKTATISLEAHPYYDNPRLLDRLLAVCTVALGTALVGAVWMVIQPEAYGSANAEPIRIEIRTPDLPTAEVAQLAAPSTTP